MPVALSVWLDHYLTAGGGDMTIALAGFLSLLLFAVAGLARFSGGRLEQRGASETLLPGVAAPFAPYAY